MHDVDSNIDEDPLESRKVGADDTNTMRQSVSNRMCLFT